MSPNTLMRPTRGKAGIGWVLSPALALALLAAGCDNKASDNNTSNTYLFTVEMRGDDGDDITSDVCIGTVADPELCSVFNDNAIVTMLAAPKDQSAFVNPNGLNDIFINRYRVTFIRSDGRNVPGVDVPYPFDGATSFRVPISGQSSEHSFTIVRHQAKVETPLSELRQIGGSLILSTIAQVDFYGLDGSGRAVQVSGFINVAFGDFADN